jgi:dTDP-glucose 4,6-dehydratase
MKNVLVTGGAGFIGSTFVRHLLREAPAVRIVNLDALTYAGSLENLKDLPAAERHLFIRGDICDSALVGDLLRTHRIDTIVHFAAESHVDRSIRAPASFVRTNVVGTFTLLEAARSVWLEEQPGAPLERRFHHVSTDEVFGSLPESDPPFDERTPYAPSSPYAAAKAAGDHLVRAYARTYGLPVTISVCSNNYGPFQFPEKLIPLTILNALEERPLPVYGDGGQVRDWLHVEDHCRAVRLILENGRPGETYALGGGNARTNLEIVKRICSILDEILPGSTRRPHESLIAFVADRPGHDRRYALDSSKAGRDLGWTPREELERGLRKTVEWYLAHGEWVRVIRAGREYREWMETNYAGRKRTD